MITSATRLYTVLGDPVAHSLSPAMHNAAFAATGYNGVYVALRVTDIRPAARGLKSLGIRGASITIPHKVRVMEVLDHVDENAASIGAVNTVANHNSVLSGYNTDSLGAARALLEHTPIRGKQAVILGAGGAARAVGFGVVREGGRVTIVNRTWKRGECLAEDLGGRFVPWSEIKRAPCDLLINTTPVGMSPHPDAMPVPEDYLNWDMVVMDAVYSPLKTRLLLTAEKKGCRTINGVGMFVHQGALQFERWTGRTAPRDIMKNTVLSILGRHPSS